MKKELLKTEEAITMVKETFSKELLSRLELTRVSSPLAIPDGTGVNDDLNGTEKPVSFDIKNLPGRKAVIVQSLAKWKRLRLEELGIEAGRGILTDMHALRPDEVLSPLHSVYVDQWDWEKRINPGDRTLAYLKTTVSNIYKALKHTEEAISIIYPEVERILPDEITYIHSNELLSMYPGLSPSERETKAAERFGAIFLEGIGCRLDDGSIHDGRAPDYDDWSTLNEEGTHGLNGDIIVWNPVLRSAFEISSMGIRVNQESLLRQLKIRECTDRLELPFHKSLFSGALPLSIGGGIGQSRVCMYMLRRSHIKEVQVGIWPETVSIKSSRPVN